jgi:hypothetical protein
VRDMQTVATFFPPWPYAVFCMRIQVFRARGWKRGEE